MFTEQYSHRNAGENTSVLRVLPFYSYYTSKRLRDCVWWTSEHSFDSRCHFIGAICGPQVSPASCCMHSEAAWGLKQFWMSFSFMFCTFGWPCHTIQQICDDLCKQSSSRQAAFTQEAEQAELETLRRENAALRAVLRCLAAGDLQAKHSTLRKNSEATVERVQFSMLSRVSTVKATKRHVDHKYKNATKDSIRIQQDLCQ